MGNTTNQGTFNHKLLVSIGKQALSILLSVVVACHWGGHPQPHNSCTMPQLHLDTRHIEPERPTRLLTATNATTNKSRRARWLLGDQSRQCRHASRALDVGKRHKQTTSKPLGVAFFSFRAAAQSAPLRPLGHKLACTVGGGD